MGEPTLPDKYRTVNVDATGDSDVYKTSPWRAPGTAKVFGSGCGSAGGGPVGYANGGFAPKGVAQGADGLSLPKQNTTVWKKGSHVEVAWAISANHGGGYSYRLCKSDGNVTEECFQRTPLKFAGDTQWILYPNGTRRAFPLTKVTEGVFPEGSEWARDPVPGCNICDPYKQCGAPLTPVPGQTKSLWDAQVNCYAMCDGAGSSKVSGSCPDGTPNFPEQVPGISGFGKYVWEWSIMDKVVVPSDIPAGDYLLSWRWDCEESTQVWQNCADIQIVEDTETPRED